MKLVKITFIQRSISFRLSYYRKLQKSCLVKPPPAVCKRADILKVPVRTFFIEEFVDRHHLADSRTLSTATLIARRLASRVSVGTEQPGVTIRPRVPTSPIAF